MVSLNDRRFLLISPEPWGPVRMSKHHYARALADLGAEVIFLEPPQLDRVEVREEEGILVWNGPAPRKGLRFLPKPWRRLVQRKDAASLCARAAGGIDVIWSFDNSRYFDFSAFRSDCFAIHHVMDHNMDFQFKTACRTADLCLGVTQDIVRRMEQHCGEAHFIQHGFVNRPEQALGVDAATGRRCFYAGNLAIGYIAWDWLLPLIARHPDIEFVFAGNNQPDKAKPEFRASVEAGIASLRAFENVRLIGPRPAAELPTWMATADILLLAYDWERFGPQVYNSHKIMEYLGSGKVVVANRTESYRGSDLLVMADSADEFCQRFSDVLANLERYNAPDCMELRRQFAQSHSYARQVERILKLTPYG